MNAESKEIIEVMKEMFSGLNSRMDKFDFRMDKFESRLESLESGQKEIKLTLENDIKKNINLLVEGHLQNAEKINKIDTIAEEVELLKFDVDVVKAVVTTHSSKLQAMKKVL